MKLGEYRGTPMLMGLHYFRGMHWSWNAHYRQIENLAVFGTIDPALEDINIVWLSPNPEEVGLPPGGYTEDQIRAFLIDNVPTVVKGPVPVEGPPIKRAPIH